MTSPINSSAQVNAAKGKMQKENEDSAIFKILKAKLKTPRNLEELYAVALRAGLTQNEVNKVKDVIRYAEEHGTDPGKALEGVENRIWYQYYNGLEQEYRQPEGLRQRSNLQWELPGASNSMQDPYLYRPEHGVYGDARPALPDYWSTQHPALEREMGYDQGPQVMGGQLYKQIDYPRDTADYDYWVNTPEAKAIQSGNAAVGAGALAVQGLLKSLTGNVRPPSPNVPKPRYHGMERNTDAVQAPSPIPKSTYQQQVPTGRDPLKEIYPPYRSQHWKEVGYQPNSAVATPTPAPKPKPKAKVPDAYRGVPRGATGRSGRAAV